MGLAICYWEIFDFVLEGYREKSYVCLLGRWSHVYVVISEFLIFYYLRDWIESVPAKASMKQDLIGLMGFGFLMGGRKIQWEEVVGGEMKIK